MINIPNQVSEFELWIQTRTYSFRIQNKSEWQKWIGVWMKHNEIHQKLSSHELSLQKLKFPRIRWFEESTTSNYSMIYNKSLEGSFKYLSLRSCCQLWIYKYTLTMIVDIYSLQLETSRSALLKICIVNVKRLLLCVTFQKIKMLHKVMFRVAKKRWQKLPPM